MQVTIEIYVLHIKANKVCVYMYTSAFSLFQDETDAQLQHQIEYAVLDDSKKKNKKGDKLQSVSIQ